MRIQAVRDHMKRLEARRAKAAALLAGTLFSDPNPVRMQIVSLPSNSMTARIRARSSRGIIHGDNAEQTNNDNLWVGGRRQMRRSESAAAAAVRSASARIASSPSSPTGGTSLLPHRPASSRRARRPVSARRAGAGGKTSNAFSRVRDPFSRVRMRSEIRRKLEELQRSPFGRPVKGARRPDKEYKRVRDLHYDLATRGRKYASRSSRSLGNTSAQRLTSVPVSGSRLSASPPHLGTQPSSTM